MSSNKPFPSSDLDVFKENSLILDNFVNSQENEYPDRFARKRPTITGIIKEAFNVRTDISNMNEALIGQSRWDAVPKNTSLSLGGDNGALNKQAQALFNRTVMLKVHAREALRRTYQEAGYNLVEGSFEEGGVLVNANDVLLQERTGKAFSGSAGPVSAGTNPVGDINWKPQTATGLRSDLINTSNVLLGDALVGVMQPFTGARSRTQHDKNKDVINVADFTGFDPSGNTDSSAAFNAALQAAKLNNLAANTVVIPAGVFLVKDVNLDSPVHLIGAGKLNTTIRPVADGDVCFRMTSTFGHISGISIQSNEGPSSNSTGISIENSLNTVEDCSFAFLKHCIFSDRGFSAAELDIRHNRFAASEFGVALLGGQINTRFLMNTYAGCKHGLLIAEDLSMGIPGTTEGIKIVGDLFYACGDSATNASGIEIVGTRWTWFDDVMVDLSAGAAVTLLDAKYVKMTNGYYSSNASINKPCVEVKGDCVDFHADGVKFSDSREFGLVLTRVGSTFPGRALLVNCVFQFNDIDAAQQGDILINSVPSVLAVNCTFTANKPSGIAIIGDVSNTSTLTCSRCSFNGEVIIGNPASCRFYSYDSRTHPDKQQGLVTIPNGAAFIDVPKTTVSLVGAPALVFATAADAPVALSCGVVGSSVRITRDGTAGDLVVQYQSYLAQ